MNEQELRQWEIELNVTLQEIAIKEDELYLLKQRAKKYHSQITDIKRNQAKKQYLK